ncbi:MAG: RusA family crossover junction endodeoxyribonuclease [Firmicutes bacterium HGW-Firmicutes-16]|nr:MAG: RusA family crossover junction endodeoxyribonuclease [Firmicutes bacterium HGW-Firmicutes-16]
MHTEFFIPMNPPTVTQQEHKVNTTGTKARFYEPAEVKATRSKLSDAVGPHRPEQPYVGAVRLMVKWCFPVCGKHKDGEYRTSKPDTDNLQKMLKDVMTTNHFWKDDAQVASEICEKFWAKVPGLYIAIEDCEGRIES